MDLMEYKAKELFGAFDLPISSGVVIDDMDTFDTLTQAVELPCMVKAQVMIGGRGKAGGIRRADTRSELREVCDAIMGMDIRGHRVEKLLITKCVHIAREWYLGVTLDRLSKCPVIIFSSMGGVEIEQTAATNPEEIIKLRVDPLVGVQLYHARYLVSKSGLAFDFLDPLWAVLQNLYRLFCGYKCTLCEINPLAVDDGGRLVAVDAKVVVDDSALDADLTALKDELERDPLVLEARKYRFLFIPCDNRGNLAVISNGSGMLMSCIDAISRENMCVHSVLDLGGGATADRIMQALRIVLRQQEVRGLFINIFGGITRCDEVANGIAKYVSEHDADKLIVVRFEGTNKEQGMKILSEIGRDHILFADGLQQGVAVLAERRGQL